LAAGVASWVFGYQAGLAIAAAASLASSLAIAATLPRGTASPRRA